MLGYKTTWKGGQLVVADRWYPSSKTGTAAAGEAGTAGPQGATASRELTHAH
jgi:hypothetical protein